MHTLLGLVLASLAHGSFAGEPTSHLDDRAARAARNPGLHVILEETRLVASSRGDEPFVLLLASPTGALVARTLAPGAILETEHPPLGLAGLTLEVLAAPGGRLASSGRLALDGAPLSLRVHASEGAEKSWLAVASDRALLRGQGSLPIPCASAEPLHVPIPSPGDKPPGDTPPPVENEPLPPV